MDSTKVFCPNEACAARGQVGKGNTTVHDRKKRRYRCQVCKKPFSQRKGTPLYRRRRASETVTLVLKLLASGCPMQAIVLAFGLDERTVMKWLERAGAHCQRLQQQLVETPRLLAEVQLDEIRLKRWHRAVGWMALAIEVPTRLWLAGAVAPERDAQLLRTLVERVKRASSALGGGLLFVTDGLAASVSVIEKVFRQPQPRGQPGRPQLMVKRYVAGNLEGIDRRLVQASAQMIDSLRHKPGGAGVLNTAFIERFNGTLRGHIAALGRRTRALAGRCISLHWAMVLTGTVYNFCCEHRQLATAWLDRGSQMVGPHAGHGRRVDRPLPDDGRIAQLPPSASTLDSTQTTWTPLTGTQSPHSEVGLMSTLKCGATVSPERAYTLLIPRKEVIEKDEKDCNGVLPVNRDGGNWTDVLCSIAEGQRYYRKTYCRRRWSSGVEKSSQPSF